MNMDPRRSALQTFNADERDAILNTVRLWLEVRAENGKGTVNHADVAHSSLLRRMLSGKAPLSEAPPRAFSYPWYELIETGHARYVEASFDRSYEDGSPIVYVEQCPWKIQETVKENEDYIISFGHYVFRLSYDRDSHTNDKYCWKLERWVPIDPFNPQAID